jgi:pyruvate,water dikinase
MTGPETVFVVELHDPGQHGAEVLGTKAATLARLAGSGFRVPDGFVITVAACDRILAATGDLNQPMVMADIPEEVRAEIRSHLKGLGEATVAVRSSGLAEDLGDASYAGQYETVLDVEGPEELAEAIGRCLASTSSAQVRAYTGSDAPAPMAVLVQRMVPADAAGVAFTANPVTGDSEILVSAVRAWATGSSVGKQHPTNGSSAVTRPRS